MAFEYYKIKGCSKHEIFDTNAIELFFYVFNNDITYLCESDILDEKFLFENYSKSLYFIEMYSRLEINMDNNWIILNNNPILKDGTKYRIFLETGNLKQLFNSVKEAKDYIIKNNIKSNQILIAFRCWDWDCH